MIRHWLVLVLVLGLGPAVAAKETTLKIATVAPEGTPWTKSLAAFDKELRAATHGDAVGFKVYAGGVQGDERVVLRKIKAGQLQAAGLTGMGLGEICPWVRLFDLPFQYRTPEELDYVRGKLDARMRAEFERRGYVLIAWSEVGTAYLFSNQKLMTVADVQRSKPWLWEGDPLVKATFAAYGVNPTPLALPDVLTSLQTGLIDTVYNSATGCIGLQWFTKLRYRIDIPLGIAGGGTVVSKKAFDQLSEGQKTALIELGAGYEKKLIQTSRKDNEEALKVLAEKQIEPLTWDPKEVARSREIGAKVSDEVAGEGEGKLYPKALLDEVREHLKAAREKK